jgi:hypothetical protein
LLGWRRGFHLEKGGKVEVYCENMVGIDNTHIFMLSV